MDVYDEFIEVANIGPVDWNTAGWRLDTGPDSTPFILPSLTVKPGERAIFYGNQSGVRLTDGGATVRLLSNSGVVFDARTYTVVKTPDKSTCRIRDLSGDWYQDCFPTAQLLQHARGSSRRCRRGPGWRRHCAAWRIRCLQEFVLAECSAFGEDMWNSLYWDKAAEQGQIPVRQNGSKWEIFVE